MKKTLLLLMINTLIITGCSGSKTEKDTVQPEPAEEVSVIEEITEADPAEIVEEIVYGTDYESTWGDLIEANGGEPVWDTLTPYQQSLVNYPEFDANNVYWTPKGSNYHAVDWCYTLSRSNTVINGTIYEAVELGHGPCSKCVGD